ncbi:hypothetical protein ANAEL_01741 [Anaerolineales bacterium]|nr:hypothetical protein ANAEL_01741 [Anaerolineales bacterium]
MLSKGIKASKKTVPLQQLSDKFNTKLVRFFILLFIVAATAIVRIRVYGDPRLSIASNDTESYVKSSRAPLFSSEMMSGRRPLTTNLIYKALEAKEGYKILANGSLSTIPRTFQAGFERIAILQFVLSIIGWGFLAFIISEQVKNPLLKILSIVTITLFAHTPQMADWDSILMSESLTFSLFALQLAFLIKLVFSIHENPGSKMYVHGILWAVTYFLWTFLKDTNLFASFVTIGMVSVLLFSIKYRQSKLLYGVLAFVSLILILGFVTSGKSTRSQIQLINIYRDDLLRSPAWISTLKELGMPEPESDEYQLWFKEKSAGTLLKFMFVHPSYPIIKVMRDFPQAFTEIQQTYFKAPEQGKTRLTLLLLGNALHPETATPFLLDFILFTGLIILATKNLGKTSRPWAWLGIWLFLTASFTLIPTILGDTWALNRHALFSTMVYRLFMWMFTIIITDIATAQTPQEQIFHQA